MNQYNQVYVISSSSFTPDQLSERWRPRDVVLSPANDNIIFVKNLLSVVFLRFSASGLIFINKVQIFDSADDRVEWEVVATTKSLAVVVSYPPEIKPSSGSLIKEFNIQDVFNPTYLKQLNYFNNQFTFPLSVTHAADSPLVHVKVKIGDSIGLWSYRLETAGVSTSFWNLDITAEGAVCAAKLKESVVLQYSSSGPFISKNFYFNPYMMLTAIAQGD